MRHPRRRGVPCAGLAWPGKHHLQARRTAGDRNLARAAPLAIAFGPASKSADVAATAAEQVESTGVPAADAGAESRARSDARTAAVLWPAEWPRAQALTRRCEDTPPGYANFCFPCDRSSQRG